MAKRRTKKWLICETLGCSQQRQGHIVPKPTDAVRLETQRVVILREIQHVVRGSLYRAEGSGERRTLGSGGGVGFGLSGIKQRLVLGDPSKTSTIEGSRKYIYRLP